MHEKDKIPIGIQSEKETERTRNSLGTSGSIATKEESLHHNKSLPKAASVGQGNINRNKSSERNGSEHMAVRIHPPNGERGIVHVEKRSGPYTRPAKGCGQGGPYERNDIRCLRKIRHRKLQPFQGNEGKSPRNTRHARRVQARL